MAAPPACRSRRGAAHHPRSHLGHVAYLGHFAHLAHLVYRAHLGVGRALRQHASDGHPASCLALRAAADVEQDMARALGGADEVNLVEHGRFALSNSALSICDDPHLRRLDIGSAD